MRQGMRESLEMRSETWQGAGQGARDEARKRRILGRTRRSCQGITGVLASVEGCGNMPAQCSGTRKGIGGTLPSCGRPVKGLRSRCTSANKTDGLGPRQVGYWSRDGRITVENDRQGRIPSAEAGRDPPIASAPGGGNLGRGMGSKSALACSSSHRPRPNLARRHYAVANDHSRRGRLRCPRCSWCLHSLAPSSSRRGPHPAQFCLWLHSVTKSEATAPATHEQSNFPHTLRPSL